VTGAGGFVTVGGVAIQAYGAQRMTQDLDDVRLLESLGTNPEPERDRRSNLGPI